MKKNYTDIQLMQADEIIERAMYGKGTNDVTIYSNEIFKDLEFRGWINCHRLENGILLTFTKHKNLEDKLRKGKFSEQYKSGTL